MRALKRGSVRAFSGGPPGTLHASLIRRLANCHFCTVGEPVEIIGSDYCARLDSFDCRNVAIRRVHGDGLHRDGLVWLEQIHERAFGVALNDRVRHERRIVRCVHEQSRVDELIWKKRFVLVGENGLELERAGRRVNLIIESLESSRGKFFSLERGRTRPPAAFFLRAIAAEFEAGSPQRH